MISSVGIDNTITVKPASLAASSVGIDSTVSRVTSYLSKSRSRRIFESLLAEVTHWPFRRSEVLQVITFGTLKAKFDIERCRTSSLVFRL
ncbi:hypothetical protein ACFX13_013412 [Malus domestica]